MAGFHHMHLVLILVFVGIFTGITSIWLVNISFKRKKVRLHQQLRDISSAARDKQLQEAKDNGEFDKWGNNS
ncbi:MAG: hypothetical protein HQ513_16745 [Rhodospirillales bacterium]|nr:hypothetical protein [Rhodospirillales bacterium]